MQPGGTTLQVCSDFVGTVKAVDGDFHGHASAWPLCAGGSGSHVRCTSNARTWINVYSAAPAVQAQVTSSAGSEHLVTTCASYKLLTVSKHHCPCPCQASLCAHACGCSTPRNLFARTVATADSVKMGMPIRVFAQTSLKDQDWQRPDNMFTTLLTPMCANNCSAG